MKKMYEKVEKQNVELDDSRWLWWYFFCFEDLTCIKIKLLMMKDIALCFSLVLYHVCYMKWSFIIVLIWRSMTAEQKKFRHIEARELNITHKIKKFFVETWRSSMKKSWKMSIWKIFYRFSFDLVFLFDNTHNFSSVLIFVLIWRMFLHEFFNFISRQQTFNVDFILLFDN